MSKLIIHFIDHTKIGKIINRNIDESAITKRITNNFLQVFVIHVTINEKFHSFVENRLKE